MSTAHNNNEQGADADLEKTVVKYLRDHPEFFARHIDLLADLRLPHASGQAVSLMERQVSVLRDQKDEVRRKLQHLMKVAQANERVARRINTLILALLDAGSLDEILATVEQHVLEHFDADAVVLRLFAGGGESAASPKPEFQDWSPVILEAFEKVIAGRKPVCGHLKPGQLESLFADQAERIASAALIPLLESEQSQECYGLLAIGSRDAKRFNPEMGTLFLNHLGQVLVRVLKPYLKD